MTLRRRTLVREINPHLICVLCSGYFIEATTIVECLHSFCRSCLVKYLEKNKFCPICDVQLHKNNPLLSVRCDPTLQQLVYKLIPGLYGREMLRRKKYYSELGGPSSDPDCGEFPVGDAYFSPEDSISLSLEFVKNDDEQGVHHRRYLQCPAAVTMSHLKKFLRMKYGLSHDHNVDIIYSDEVLNDDFSLMDVAYTFAWNRATPMRFKFRLMQKNGGFGAKKDEGKPVKKEKRAGEDLAGPEAKRLKIAEDKAKEERLKEERLKKEKDERLKKEKEERLKEERLKKEKEERLKKEKEERLKKEKEERLKEKEERLKKEKEERLKKESEERIKRETEERLREEKLRKEKQERREEEKARKERKEKERREKEKKQKYVDIEEDIEEIDDDDDRLQITTADDDIEEIEVYRKSEERRKEKKKAKKAKHHHHHRHRSPPAATILHSPENDIMKLKIKLNDKKYVVEEKKENGYKEKEDKKADVANNNEEIKTKNEVASKELAPKKPMKLTPKNGDVKMPPSSITVSKITAAEKRQMEQQKIHGDKRPSLEIMLVNAPKKEEVKKVIRPPPQSIPLSRVKTVFPKSSPPPLIAKNDEALDLSKRSPDADLRNLITLSDTAVQRADPPTLKIPAYTKMPFRAVKPVPNQTVRQIPNPSALMFRNMNGRGPPPVVPINALRKMESMTRNIEKVAAGLTVKAAVEAGFALK